jgi:hypothetical protein
MARKQVSPDAGRRPSPRARAARLVRRGWELGSIEYHYAQLVGVYEILFRHLEQKGLGRSEFVKKADRPALARLQAILDGEIRPQRQAVAEEFVGLFGVDWRDCIRVANPGRATFELQPTRLYFNPWETRPTAQLMGRGLKRDGRPGERIVQTPLILGVSKVTVVSGG